MSVKKIDVDKEYKNWVKKIAYRVSLEDLIKHLREHVGEHYDRYDRTKSLNLDIWLVDVLNFMYILQAKKLKITKTDLLFKLALHYRNHNDGPKPDFDVIRFLKDYQGRYKKFDRLSLKYQHK